VTVNFEIEELDIKLDSSMKENPWNTTVKTSSNFVIKTKLSAAATAAKFAINSLFADGGLALEPLIEQKFPWLNLTEAVVDVGDGWLGIQVTPQFDKHKIIPPTLASPFAANKTDITIENSYALPLYDSMVGLVEGKEDCLCIKKPVCAAGNHPENTGNCGGHGQYPYYCCVPDVGQTMHEKVDKLGSKIE